MGQGGSNVILLFVVLIQSDFVKKIMCDRQNQLTCAHISIKKLSMDYMKWFLHI